jgi:hypothetical protein
MKLSYTHTVSRVGLIGWSDEVLDGEELIWIHSPNKHYKREGSTLLTMDPLLTNTWRVVQWDFWPREYLNKIPHNQIQITKDA